MWLCSRWRNPELGRVSQCPRVRLPDTFPAAAFGVQCYCSRLSSRLVTPRLRTIRDLRRSGRKLSHCFIRVPIAGLALTRSCAMLTNILALGQMEFHLPFLLLRRECFSASAPGVGNSLPFPRPQKEVRARGKRLPRRRRARPMPDCADAGPKSQPFTAVWRS